MDNSGLQDGSSKALLHLIFVLAIVIAMCLHLWELMSGLLFIGIPLLVIADAERRESTWASFKHKDVGPVTDRFRRRLMRWLFALGIATAVIDALACGLNNLEWYLIPILLLAAAIRLRGLSISHGQWERLQRALCDNLLELLMIGAIVLTCYLVMVWPLGASSTTVKQLQDWDKDVVCTREWLKDHVSGFWFITALFAVTFALRVVASLRPAFENRSRTVGTVLATGLKWSGRASTAAVFASTLTFLAVQDNGPGGKIGLTIKNAKDNYANFHRLVTAQVDAKFRQGLVEKAWSERPPVLRQETAQLNQLQQERDEYERLRKQANDEFHVRDVTPDLSLTLPRPKQPAVPHDDLNDEFASMWTPDALRQAALYEETPAPSATDTASLNNPGWKHNPFAEAYDSVTKPGPGAPTNQGEGLPAPTTPFKTAEIPHGNAESGPQENEADNSDEIAKRAWDALPVGEFLFDRTPFLGTVKSYYPGFGELLGVIYSSVTGVIFENARDWVVEQVITKWAVDGEVTATTIPELVAARVSMIHFDFSSFTPSWTQTAAEKISRAREQVKNARTQLLRATLDKEREETAELARDTQEDARLLGTAGMALHSSGLEKTAQSVQNFTTELADLGKSWPPLTGPDTSHFVRLAEISEKIQSADLENSGGSSSWGSKQPQESVVLRKAAQSPIAAGLHLVPEWQSPIAAIRDLDRFCKARTLMIVAEVTSAGAEWKPLMDAMGRSQFHYYYMIVESEVKQPPEVKKAIPKINDWHVKIDGEKDKGNEQPAKEPDPIKPRLEFR